MLGKNLQFVRKHNKITENINLCLVKIFNQGKIIDSELLNISFTITKINLSNDFSIVDCYFVPFNTKYHGKFIEDLLNKFKKNIRKLLSSEINLKHTPELRFYYDYGFENLGKVEKLLTRCFQ